MPTGHIDLADLVRRMASRTTTRTEANVQSELHAFLLAAPLDLEEQQLRDLDVVLEQQAGSRKRIDVEAGFCVFEVKKDLRRPNVRDEAVEQLAGYVAARTTAMNQRYVGVLTDGAEWHLYHLEDASLREVAQLAIDPQNPDVDALCVWLEGVLATSEQITPTPSEIEHRLGASSPGHLLDYAELAAIYARHRELPTVKLKRALWARLLTTAFGTGFTDSDELFVEHTLLVASAEIIAHAVMGLDPAAQHVSAAALLGGALFADSQVFGVVEADFFDWVVEFPEGQRFVKALARRLVRFAWRDVEHDVLKVLYESVISAAQRKRLGEYYTPDWLASSVVDQVVTAPLSQRVLDPACGSGTFVFHAVRRYIEAAEAAGTDNATALKGVTTHVLGMDIHPVAVTFARVTYLLAIGTGRLQAEDRPPLSVPVYLGDSIQWGQEQSLFTRNALVVRTAGGQLEFGFRDLRFPERTLEDAGQFDRLVAELTDRATLRRAAGSPVPSLAAVFRTYGVHPDDQAVLNETFSTLCSLHDQGANHIWGYYVRNLARPVWLTRPPNRVDVLLGNPPWLSYRFMTQDMQQEFRTLSEERGLWAGASVATHQDLSALFVLRCMERYLKPEGRFGFVMPWSVLRGRHFTGFRTGSFTLRNHQRPLTLAFDQAWDLHAVKPTFFPVPSSVVFGRIASPSIPLSSTVEGWSGRLPHANISRDQALQVLTRTSAVVREAADAGEDASPYHSRFSQGASVVPRMMFVVEQRAAGPLGAGAGRTAITSRRTPNEKTPWKNLPALDGTVERQFVRPMLLGETILPYRVLEPVRAVIPWDAQRLLHAGDERLSSYPGLEEWLTNAEALWKAHGTSQLSLRDQLDYRHKLSSQFPLQPNRVVYTKSGMYLAAARAPANCVIDHKLYWGTTITVEEARFLEAILNSDALTLRVRPLQARGEHNPRDYDKYVWQVPIPLYSPADARHVRLARLAEQAEALVSSLQLPRTRFEAQRRVVRETLAASPVGQAIEALVAALLS
jgi:SAM-dependent methyltransferase